MAEHVGVLCDCIYVHSSQIIANIYDFKNKNEKSIISQH